MEVHEIAGQTRTWGSWFYKQFVKSWKYKKSSWKYVKIESLFFAWSLILWPNYHFHKNPFSIFLDLGRLENILNLLHNCMQNGRTSIFLDVRSCETVQSMLKGSLHSCMQNCRTVQPSSFLMSGVVWVNWGYLIAWYLQPSAFRRPSSLLPVCRLQKAFVSKMSLWKQGLYKSNACVKTELV